MIGTLYMILFSVLHSRWSVAMQPVTRTVTSIGRVTIPKRIRELLGIDATDTVTFVVDESGPVELRPISYQWEDLRGIVPPVPGKE
jgi:AbrB family looped-hinge helix DNA binding protein